MKLLPTTIHALLLIVHNNNVTYLPELYGDREATATNPPLEAELLDFFFMPVTCLLLAGTTVASLYIYIKYMTDS